MKRLSTLALFGVGIAVLAGCPIYSDNSGDYQVCTGGACYDCPDQVYSQACSPWSCGSNNDCPNGYSCDSSGTCSSGGEWDGGYGYEVDASVPPSGCTSSLQCGSGETCGADGECHSGDCSEYGCPSGQVCELAGGALSCVSESTFEDSGLGFSYDAGAPPSDDASTPFSGCQTSSDCAAVSGALCLDGQCVAPANQCSDGTQCASGDQCVDGACVPMCTASDAGASSGTCAVGYSCDANGDCTGNPTHCANGASVCAGGTVCAQDHCVSPCPSDGGSCGTGFVCVQGGCVEAQAPNLECGADGSQGGCAAGSTCLHHSCYIACSSDAGASACATADQFNECKSVTTASGSYSVCGSATNLGSQCDPTRGLACASSFDVCIDGFCR